MPDSRLGGYRALARQRQGAQQKNPYQMRPGMMYPGGSADFDERTGTYRSGRMPQKPGGNYNLGPGRPGGPYLPWNGPGGYMPGRGGAPYMPWGGGKPGMQMGQLQQMLAQRGMQQGLNRAQFGGQRDMMQGQMMAQMQRRMQTQAMARMMMQRLAQQRMQGGGGVGYF